MSNDMCAHTQSMHNNLTYILNWERSVCAKNASSFCVNTFFSDATFAPHVLKLHGIICAKNKTYDCVQFDRP